jgi:hypothetical protein
LGAHETDDVFAHLDGLPDGVRKEPANVHHSVQGVRTEALKP